MTRSSSLGESTSASVENITPRGLWLLVGGKEYFLPFSEFPYFKKASIQSIHNVEFKHGFHLYWPQLDVDLTIDNLEHPERYPLRAKHPEPKAKRRASSIETARV